MFRVEEYASALQGHTVKTFIDLGCNAGWFALWLTARGRDRLAVGLLVDANPRMVAEAAWHIERNGLHCEIVHGAVGMPPGQSSTTFYLHPSSAASSVLAYVRGKQLPAKGRINELKVPAVSVATEWIARFADAPVDLLKVDIEGKELDFVVYEGAFLRERVQTIIVEWHKWSVSLPQLDAQLASVGFVRGEVHNESDTAGLALYHNQGGVARAGSLPA